MKNLAIMGAMLYIVAYGPGPFSLGKDACSGGSDAPPAGKKKKR